MKRSAPAVHVLVERFGLWNAGILVLVLLSMASVFGWLFNAAVAAGGLDVMLASVSLPVTVFTLAATLALVFPLFSLRSQAVSLRWDGQTWHLGPDNRVGDEPWPAELIVRVDLGIWMLAQVRSSAPGFPRGWAWLPIQKRGFLPLQWHGLRCALFAAPPRLSLEGAGRAGEE